MTKENCHEITCERCGKVVPKKQAKQRYCSVKCRTEHYKYPLVERKCEVCNDTFETRNNSITVTCSKFCGIVYHTVNKQKYTDEELTHLVLLNKGYGFTRFCEKLRMQKDRLMYLRDVYLEERKIDLFAILQDPDGLITMRRDEWIAKGRPARPFGNGARGNGIKNAKEMLETYKRYEQSEFQFDQHDRRTQSKVKVYPEFNWGPYEGRN